MKFNDHREFKVYTGRKVDTKYEIFIQTKAGHMALKNRWAERLPVFGTFSFLMFYYKVQSIGANRRQWEEWSL